MTVPGAPTGPQGSVPAGAPLGEDDLVAYVDGRLDSRRLAEVEAYLAAHADARAGVTADREIAASLREQLAPLHAEPIPARLRVANIRAAAAARRAGRLRAMAAGLALLLVGAGGGFLAAHVAPAPPQPGATTSVAQEASAAYRTFVVEAVHPVEVDASREAHLLGWLSKRLGRPLTAPDLTRFGYRLMGGRLLPGGQGAAAQLMYESGAGQRLTLYVAASMGGETAFRFSGGTEASTFAWIDRGFGFAVTGPGGREALLPIAEAVYQDFETPPAPLRPREG